MESFNFAQINANRNTVGFLDSIAYALMDILSNPLCLVMYSVAMVQALFIYLSNSDDPLFWLYDALKIIVDNPNTPKLVCVVLHIVMSVVLFELKWRLYFVVIILTLISSCKTFDPVKFFLSVAIAGILILSKYNIILILIYSHLWILYTSTLEPTKKFFLIVITVFVGLSVHYLDPHLVLSTNDGMVDQNKLKLRETLNRNLSNIYLNRTT